MKRVRLIIYISILQLVAITAKSQLFSDKRIKLDHLTVSDGLSQSSVLSILHDQYGFSWLGTRDGLNLYNGYGFTVFRHNQTDSTSIAGNFIQSIAEDNHGNIWVATDQGLSSFTRALGYFKNYKFPAPYQEDPEVKVIVKDTSGIIWVGSQHGLLYIDTVENSAKFFKAPRNTVSGNSITSLFVDSKNRLWVGTARHGVFKISADRLHIQSYEEWFEDADVLGSNRIEAITEDKNGNLWIGTYGNGLFKIDEKRTTTNHIHTHSFDYPIASNNIRSLLCDSSGHIWVGTFEGLTILNPLTSEFRNLNYEEGVPDGLSHNSIRALHVDKKGSVWIGTYFGGVNIFDADNQRFEHFYHIPANTNSISYNVVGAFAEDQLGNVFIGTERGGLTIRNTKSNKHSFIGHEPQNEKTLSGNTVKALHVDSRGAVWAGIFRGGLNRIDAVTKIVTRYPKNQPALASLQQAVINTVVETNNGMLWIGTDDQGGIQKFDTRNEQFIKFKNSEALVKAIGSAPVKSIWIDQKNQLWLATRGSGLIVFDEERGVVNHFNKYPDELPTSELTFVANTREGIIWIGTQGEGLVMYNPASQRFTKYTVADGLQNNIALGMLEDARGRLWFLTMNGLSRFDPSTEIFSNYSHATGLPLQEINEGAFFALQDGRFLVGGSNGYVSFYPDQLSDNEFIPPVSITNVLVYNKRVRPNDGSGVLMKEAWVAEEIELNWRQSVFTIEFAALNYLRASQNQYQYKLVGFDEHWMNVDNRRTVTYTNLRDGTYTFLVKGSNNDGVWNDVPAMLVVRILPPPWKTWWAFLGYALIIIVGFLVIRYNAITSAQLKHNLKLEQVEKQRMQEMHRLKLQYFTDVSHEFRTPLTLIVNPLEELMQSQDGSPWHRKQLRLMYYNCRRLLLLMDQILEMREVETGHAQVSTVPASLINIVKNVVDSFNGLADQRSIKLSLITIASEGTHAIDVDKVEKIFFNLLANSFKFTRDGGIIQVHIRSRQDQEKTWFICKVSDTGRGIESENLSKVFERFYKSGKNTGSGIGLSLTKSFVELLGGKIKVSSKLNEGTTFTIRIPFVMLHEPDTAKDLSTPAMRALPMEYQAYLSQQNSSLFNNQDAAQTILVVEDNKDLRMYLKEQLSKRYRVITARNGEKGLQKAKKFDPQIIISDVMMEVMDGIEFCKQVKSDSTLSHIPIILLTAKGSDTDRLIGLEEGADDYLIKPFIFHELALRIKNILSNRARMHERLKKTTTYHPSVIKITSYDEKLMIKIVEIIESHIDDSNLTVSFLGNEVGLSRVHLFRKVKALTGEAPADFIRNIRLQRAAQLLKQNNLKISEIAYLVGFQDVNYFGKCFRKVYGCSATEYMQQIHTSA